MKLKLSFVFASYIFASLFLFLVFPTEPGDSLLYTISEVSADPAQVKKSLPVDEETWNSCCDHQHCRPVTAKILRVKEDGYFDIKFGKWDPVVVHQSQIHESKDGTTWYCRMDQSQPPSDHNLRCVFLPKQKNYVRIHPDPRSS